jgi:hypothetical protein
MLLRLVNLIVEGWHANTGNAMDDFSNNRKYALAWVLLAVLFAFALHVNVVIRQGAAPGGVSVGKVK